VVFPVFKALLRGPLGHPHTELLLVTYWGASWLWTAQASGCFWLGKGLLKPCAKPL